MYYTTIINLDHVVVARVVWRLFLRHDNLLLSFHLEVMPVIVGFSNGKHRLKVASHSNKINKEKFSNNLHLI